MNCNDGLLKLAKKLFSKKIFLPFKLHGEILHEGQERVLRLIIVIIHQKQYIILSNCTAVSQMDVHNMFLFSPPSLFLLPLIGSSCDCHFVMYIPAHGPTQLMLHACFVV